MKKNWIVILFLLNLTGCATYGDSIPKTTSMDQVDQLAGSHQPVEYKLGFKEGCDSGLVSAGNSSYKVQKDSARYSVDDLYKHGWDDGFNKCKQYKVQSRSYSSGYYYPSYYFGFRHFNRHRHHRHHHRHSC